MSENVDYTLCEENWEKIREVEALGEHLQRVRLWAEADSMLDQDVVEASSQAAGLAGTLLAHLIALQQHLLNNL